MLTLDGYEYEVKKTGLLWQILVALLAERAPPVQCIFYHEAVWRALGWVAASRGKTCSRKKRPN